MNQFFIIFFALIIALPVHEFAHAYTAYLLGDDTAEKNNRLTFNPLSHIDFLGFLSLILVNIGWGKPVPVNPNYFKNPLRDQALVSLAGPLSNFLLALITIFVLKNFNITYPVFFQTFAQLNIVLAVFNLLPFPPLDGSHILKYLLPFSLRIQFEKIENFIPLYFFIFLILDNILNLHIVSNLIFLPMEFIYTLMFNIS
jgi:Zn-dependent protease